MKRISKVLFYVLLGLSMVTGYVFAGTAHVNHGDADTAVLLATEVMGSNRSANIDSGVQPQTATTGALTYTPTQNLTSGNLVRVSLVNASFGAGTVYIIGFDSTAGANVRIGSALVPAAGANNVSFQLAIAGTNSMQAGGNNFICFTNSDEVDELGDEAVITAASGALNVTFLSSASSGATATIDIITSGGIVVDSASTVTIGQAGRERAPRLTSNTLRIDYINNPFDGTLFTTASSGADARNIATNAAIAFNIEYTAKNVGIAIGDYDAGLTARAALSFDNSNEWQGVSRMWVGVAEGEAMDCSLASNISNVVTPVTGTEVALNISNTADAGFNQTVADDFSAPLCIETAGNVELRPRTISGSLTVVVTGTGGVTLPATTGIMQQWVPNGFTANIPHMRYGETTRGYVRLVNNAARTGSIIGTIIKNDGTEIPGIDLGTIAQNQTVNLSAKTIGEAQGLGTGSDYTLKLSISVPPDAIYANAFFNLLSGGVWTTRDNTLYENLKEFINQK